MTYRDLPTTTHHLRGLTAEAEILIDRWGVPHIYAASKEDAFFGQGFAVARDRLWQIDLWRKRGLGLMSADYGAEFLEADRAARLLLYRGDMAAEWAVYGDGAEAFATAFTAGINAYVDLVLAEPDQMPLEFLRTGTRPAHWSPEDCVRIRSHGPMASFGREFKRAQTLAIHGPKAEALRCKLEPDWPLVPPEGIAAEPVPPEVMKVFDLGTLHSTFAASTEAAPPPDGSNNWAISGSRTVSGRPILANDPHRLLLLPSLRYVSHLTAPGLDVIGAGEPAVPGISIGHNETSAFGLTIHFVDQSDLYVYETSEDDPELYWYNGGWERLSFIEETIPLRSSERKEAEQGEGAAASHRARLAFTRHGPVLHQDRARRRIWALCSVWTAPGSAAYLAALRYMNSKSWDEFVAARDHWKTPSVNHVYADTSGDIGWIMSGTVPYRPGRDGLVPLPGDGSQDWQGEMAAHERPRLHNPERGWVATANEENLPDDFDVARHKSNFDWTDPSRYQAIARELEKPQSHSLEDSCRLQTSFANPAAERIVALLPGLTFSGDAERAAGLLRGWDGVLAVDSAPALLFEIWLRRHLMVAVAEAVVPGVFDDYRKAELADLSTQTISDLLVTPDDRLGADPIGARNELLATTLSAAWKTAVELAVAEAAKWRWGDLHHARFVHPLAARLKDETLNTRRVAKGGSGLTPNAATYEATGFAMTAGASFRMVLDVGDWDAGVFVNAPGQSGNPESRHYDDHLEPWSQESYLPLVYSRLAVEEAAVRVLRLRPA